MIADQSPITTKQSRFSLHRVALSIGFIVILMVIGTVIVRISSTKGEASPSNQVKSVLSGNELLDYKSPYNSFAIRFPGYPTVDKSSSKVGDKEVPITTYQRLIDDNTANKNYTVVVYDYEAVTLDEDQNVTLESALNSSLKDKPNISIGTTKKSTYGPYKSIEAAYTQTEKGKTYNAYIRYVVKGSKVYSVILIGADQAKFDEFANSLKLT